MESAPQVEHLMLLSVRTSDKGVVAANVASLCVRFDTLNAEPSGADSRQARHAVPSGKWVLNHVPPTFYETYIYAFREGACRVRSA
jgi:hypothetical protein